MAHEVINLHNWLILTGKDVTLLKTKHAKSATTRDDVIVPIIPTVAGDDPEIFGGGPLEQFGKIDVHGRRVRQKLMIFLMF